MACQHDNLKAYKGSRLIGIYGEAKTLERLEGVTPIALNSAGTSERLDDL